MPVPLGRYWYPGRLILGIAPPCCTLTGVPSWAVPPSQPNAKAESPSAHRVDSLLLIFISYLLNRLNWSLSISIPLRLLFCCLPACQCRRKVGKARVREAVPRAV